MEQLSSNGRCVVLLADVLGDATGALGKQRRPLALCAAETS